MKPYELASLVLLTGCLKTPTTLEGYQEAEKGVQARVDAEFAETREDLKRHLDTLLGTTFFDATSENVEYPNDVYPPDLLDATLPVHSVSNNYPVPSDAALSFAPYGMYPGPEWTSIDFTTFTTRPDNSRITDNFVESARSGNIPAVEISFGSDDAESTVCRYGTQTVSVINTKDDSGERLLELSKHRCGGIPITKVVYRYSPKRRGEPGTLVFSLSEDADSYALVEGHSETQTLQTDTAKDKRFFTHKVGEDQAWTELFEDVYGRLEILETQ